MKDNRFPKRQKQGITEVLGALDKRSESTAE